MDSVIDNIKLIVAIVSTGLSLFMVLLYIISRVSTKKATQEKAINAMETTQSVLDVLYLVQNAVIGAESNQHFTNAEKFNSAYIAVKNELLKQNKNIEDDTLATMIENEVVVSQKVNSDARQKAKADELKKIEIIK